MSVKQKSCADLLGSTIYVPPIDIPKPFLTVALSSTKLGTYHLSTNVFRLFHFFL